MAGEYGSVIVEEAASGRKVGVIRRVVGAETHDDQIFATRTAENTIGSSSIMAGATVTLATYTVGVAPAVFRLWGFRVWATGTGAPTDAKAWLEVGGIEIHADELHIGRRVATVRLPLPEPIANGTAVALKVFNRGATASFTGKILGE